MSSQLTQSSMDSDLSLTGRLTAPLHDESFRIQNDDPSQRMLALISKIFKSEKISGKEMTEQQEIIVQPLPRLSGSPIQYQARFRCDRHSLILEACPYRVLGFGDFQTGPAIHNHRSSVPTVIPFNLPRDQSLINKNDAALKKHILRSVEGLGIDLGLGCDSVVGLLCAQLNFNADPNSNSSHNVALRIEHYLMMIWILNYQEIAFIHYPQSAEHPLIHHNFHQVFSHQNYSNYHVAALQFFPLNKDLRITNTSTEYAIGHLVHSIRNKRSNSSRLFGVFLNMDPKRPFDEQPDTVRMWCDQLLDGTWNAETPRFRELIPLAEATKAMIEAGHIEGTCTL